MPISPPPLQSWRPEFIPAYLSNGLIGLRAGPIPLIEGVAIANGLAGIDPVEQDEGFARAPYPIAGDVEVDGHRLSRLPTQAQLLEQRYDFSCGELSTRFSFGVDGPQVTVEVLTFCSRSMPTVVLQEIRARVDRPCRLGLSAGLSPSGLNGRWLARETSTPGSDTPVVDGSNVLHFSRRELRRHIRFEVGLVAGRDVPRNDQPAGQTRKANSQVR